MPKKQKLVDFFSTSFFVVMRHLSLNDSEESISTVSFFVQVCGKFKRFYISLRAFQHTGLVFLLADCDQIRVELREHDIDGRHFHHQVVFQISYSVFHHAKHTAIIRMVRTKLGKRTAFGIRVLEPVTLLGGNQISIHQIFGRNRDYTHFNKCQDI